MLALLLLSVAVAASQTDNWPQFRGPHGDGISTAKSVPTTWSETENIHWKTPIRGKGWASPVVWGNQIWVSSGREDGKELYAICVDRNTGKIVHDVKVFSDPKPAYCHPFNSYASPTPVIEEGRVYVHYGVHGTACLDTATGQIVWSRKDLPCYHHRGPGSSPILWKDLLVLTFDGFDQQYITALNKTTGETVWRKPREIKYSSDNGDYRKAFATPAIFEIDGKPQLIAPAADATVAYDPATGNEIWKVYHGGMNEAARPIMAHGLIYLTSGHTMNLLAVKAGGTGDLTKTHIAWKYIKETPTRPSLLVLGDLLFMVNDGGIATCLDARTGKVIWRERLGGEFSTSPVYAAGHLYFCAQDGKTHVIAADKEFRPVAVNKFNDGFMASPAVLEGALILRTRTHLYCVGK